MKKKHSIIINIPDIGSVLFERSKIAKYINISVKPPAQIRAAVPRGISFEEATIFVIKKEDWIKRTIHKIHHRSVTQDMPQIIDKEYATDFLLKRLEKIAKMDGFIYNKAIIRNQKTRWGSCSGKNNISLNMQLINLPDTLLDYVILHELVHTLIKNHSQLFWSTLNKFVGDAKVLDKQLKKYILY